MNVWEAVYFDHDIGRLKELADIGTACGVERFVLDDGWFHGRRDDRAGLGDWWVDPDVWPDGLGPIVDHVRALGMEFGLWFEPEMVNPDSDLYRAHPDWALVDQRYGPALSRNQLVLDLSRAEVRDHLFAQMDALLSAYDIGYVKWDHNRDLAAPTSGGRYTVRAQTLGAYELLDRLREKHPGVEFESCASGGGRLDFGILDRTERVWTSDSIDALDRLRIQRGFSLLVPGELMGAHIGSAICHTTGRRHSLAFRAASAMFGALGVEWNLLDTTPREREQLKQIVATYKALRPLLHSGDLYRADHPDPSVDVRGVVASDREEAVLSITRVSSAHSHHTAPVRLIGLHERRRYRVRPLALGSRVEDFEFELTGRQLAVLGFPAPVLRPEMSLLVHVTPA